MHGQGGDKPAHHARRPMNAFLIFCKRHRSVVRDKYPNLENRSITKILGEWWANLEKEEKDCYTSLAKQYKDAFFDAHPNFKWYKLPAPPLRTLSSRPREVNEKALESSGSEHNDMELEKTNNNSTKVDFNKKPNGDIFHNGPKTLSMFTPGKLADEAQMGGISSLLATKTENQTQNPYYSPPSYKFNAVSTPNDHRSQNITIGGSKEDSIRELQNALSETTKVFEEDFDEKGRIYRYAKVPGDRYPVPNDQFTNQDVIDQIVDKRYSKDEDYQRISSDDEKTTRSGRSCKGKRYKQFMAVGGLIANKRQKRDYTDKMPDESWDPGSSRSEESNLAVNDESRPTNSLNDMSAESEIKIESIDAIEPDNNDKTFKPTNFDLEAKIGALPPLSFEKFQQKKRDNKRRKKTINLKPKIRQASHIINSVPRPVVDERRQMIESWRDSVIGSQKRKPRKISITRLELSSVVSSVDAHKAHKISPEIKIATEAPCTMLQNMDMCKQASHNVDLMGLATLAEVAANTSKLDDIMTAKASEENASKV